MESCRETAARRMRTAETDSSAAVGALGAGDNETMTVIKQTYQSADAFLFGRRTYELFAGYWGAEDRVRAAAEDPRNHPITDALNTQPKYLASNTLTEPRWANTTVLSGDIAVASAS
jgi:hypothetical protein